MDIIELTKEEMFRDDGNARRFQAYWGNRAYYVPELKRWVQFVDKKGWSIVSHRVLTRPVVKLYMVEELKRCSEDYISKELLRHIERCHDNYMQDRMANGASDFMSKSINAFDADPYVINCSNGIVDLKTGKKRDHSPNELHLKKIDIDYDPDATCPMWEKFLREIFNGKTENIEYVRLALGYSITGLTKEECFFLCYGQHGRNGKDTLLETVGYVLGRGEYYYVTDFDTFLDREVSSSRKLEAIGELKGRRFVTAAETKDSRRFDTATIKRVTGNKILKGTVLFSSSFNFEATHKIWLACNDRPAIKDPGNAMWSRPKVIVFPNSYEGRENKDLKEILRAERQGILTYLAKATKDYLALENGLPIEPIDFLKAKEEYRRENDTIEAFAGDCLDLDGNAKTPSSQLYDTYTNWCQSNSERARAQRFLRGDMQKRGYKFSEERTGNYLLFYKIRGGVHF